MLQTGSSVLVALKRRSRALALLAMVAIAAPMLTSCYGRFPLTRKVYQFNGDVTPNPIGQTLVMWAFAILPVYGGAMLADAFVINSLEYWTGERFDMSSVTTKDGTVVTMAPVAGSHDAVLTATKDGRTIAERRFVKLADGKFNVLNEQGAVVGKVIPTTTGQLQFADAHGTILQTVNPR